MREVGIFEAKTHLSRLINDVERGERFLITKRNRPVALLIPIDPETTSSGQETVKRIQQLRTKLSGKVSLAEIIQFRDETRK